MATKYIQLNAQDSAWFGVVDVETMAWVVEPEYTHSDASRMAQRLNDNPVIDPDELYRWAA